MGTDPDRGSSELNPACAAHNFVSADGRTNRIEDEAEASPPDNHAPDADSLLHAPFDLASFPDEAAVPVPKRVATFAAPPAVATLPPGDTAALRLPNGLIVRTTRRPYERRRSAMKTARRALLAVDAAAADLMLALHRTTRTLRDRGRVVLADVDAKRLFTRSRVPAIAIAALSLLTLGGLVYFSRPNPSAISAPAQSVTSPPRAVAPAAPTTVAPAAPTPVAASRVELTEALHPRETGATATAGKRVAKAAKAQAPRVVESTATVGALNITSQPAGAEVSVNGVRQGHTPVVIRGLRAGSRVVSLSLPGYERWSWSVAVVADRLTPVNVKLQQEQRESVPQTRGRSR